MRLREHCKHRSGADLVGDLSSNCFAPGKDAKYCNERVCMSVWMSLSSHISKTACPNYTKFSVHVICGHGSVLLWLHRNTLCTSGSVDDVMFAHNRPGKGDASRAYTQSDSPGAAPGAKSDVQDCLLNMKGNYYNLLYRLLHENNTKNGGWLL